MSVISNGLADQRWVTILLDAGPDFWLEVRQAMRLIAYHNGDWIIDALHNVHWSRRGNISDAVAYAEFVGLLKAERVYMAMVPAKAWAAPNHDLAANQAALDIAGVKASLNNTTQDYDGWLKIDGSIGLKLVYPCDQDTPKEVPVGMHDDGTYPIEIGRCTMAKSVAILMAHGRLARLPMEEGILLRRKPLLYLFRMAEPVRIERRMGTP